MYCPTHSRSFPKWDDVCSRVLHIARLESIENGVERMGAMEAYARERAGEGLEEQLASVEDSRERWKVIAAARDLTEEECRILRTLCRERRAAWLRMLRLIKKQLKRPLNDPEYLALWRALLLPDVLKKRRDGEYHRRQVPRTRGRLHASSPQMADRHLSSRCGARRDSTHVVHGPLPMGRGES